jgi:hypothetical protein
MSEKEMEKKMKWVDVIAALDPEFEIMDVCCKMAQEDCDGDYELLELFLERKDKGELKGSDELQEIFKDITVDTLADVTAPFWNVGFAAGYLLGQMFTTVDEDANAALYELKRALVKHGLMPFTSQRVKRQDLRLLDAVRSEERRRRDLAKPGLVNQQLQP